MPARTAAGDDDVQQCRDHHAAERGEHGEGGDAPVGELTVDESLA